MDDLISRQTFKEECLKAGFFPAQIAAALERTPAVDAISTAIRMMDKYTTFEKVWYKYYTGSKGKRKHLELKFACTECRYVWDRQAYAFRYCPGCGRQVVEIEEKTDGSN